MSTEVARVLWGANNIFSLKSEKGIVEGRIKGKKLDVKGESYNPLSPGDMVEIELKDDEHSEAMILNRLERRNEFARWNKKRGAMQTIAANIDGLYIITSPASPPFRPRFIDRALALAEYNGIPASIVLNKVDQGIDDLLQQRIDYYRKIDYPVHLISVKEHIGIEQLVDSWSDKVIMLLGQSGVGKSSLVQNLFPDAEVKTGGISEKYNRGKHTTVLAMSYEMKAGGFLIDTPGIRELDLYGIPPQDVASLFREFSEFAEHCRIPGCRHVHEPGCAVKEAVERGLILEDRYDSYINSLIVMEQSAKQRKDWKFTRL